MAEVEDLQTEEEGVALEVEHVSSTEEAYVRVFYTTRGKQEDESLSVTQPLLQHKHQDSRDENHKADTQTATDGTDRKTSVPQELELAGRDEPGCSGSVRSLCSDSSRHECPICSERFTSQGDHRVTLLNCNHELCHHCVAGIMKRAKDQGRLRCPFCRQTTPLAQWEIRRLQEELYSNSFYEPGPPLILNPVPELQSVPVSQFCCFAVEGQLETHTHICGCCPSCTVRGLRLMRPHSLCLSMSALLLLFMMLLGYLLYMLVPVIIMNVLFSDG
ncbi:uncharacterized protein LOC144458741 [Epinephelus lanceolatus]